MNFLLDLIVLAIIAAVALISARRGFVRVAIELVGFIAAIFITFTISTPLASLTYDKIIEPPIVSSVSKATGDSVTQITDDSSARIYKKIFRKRGLFKGKHKQEH